MIWGIHTGAKNELQYHGQIYDRQYAISRFGSGSHLMAIVDATVNDKTLSKEQFTIIKDLDGALASLEALETDVFYWEKYTTKPYVDSGQLRRIGEFVTPWPCFVIAARDQILEKAPQVIRDMLKVIHNSCWQFMSTDDVIPLVAERYDQQVKDVESWYHSTEWATHGWVSDKMLRSVIKNLKVAEIIDNDFDPDHLVWKR